MDKNILIELREKIKKCSECEMHEIFKILKQLNYTQNKNGIFIDMKQFDSEIVDKINNLLKYFENNKDQYSNREQLLKKIKLNTVSI